MRRKQLVISLLLAVCLLCALGQTALAADKPYTYTVRVYDGFTKTVVFHESYDYGDRCNLGGYSQGAQVGDKYYCRGVMVAGQDSGLVNNLAEPSFEVTQDVDYVLVYGIQGDMKAYTVNYVDDQGAALNPDDGTGNPLPSTEVFYGKAGDYVIVASRNIDGYQPDAYNKGKTLSENEAENVFTFVYTPILGPANPEEPGIVGDDGAAAPDGGAVIDDGGVPLDEGPQQMVDLDEGEMPLGLIDMGQDAVEKGAELLQDLPFGARVGLIGLDLLVLWLIFMAIVNHRARKKEGT